MNQKARKLSEQIAVRESLRKKLLESQAKDLEKFDTETKKLEDRLEMCIRMESPAVKSAQAWCRITNALIRKYKLMAETDPNRALKELTRIEGSLLADGFLTEQELKEAL